MKTIYFALLVIFMMASENIISQEESIANSITGTWVMDYDQTMSKLSDSSLKHLNSTNKDHRDRVKSSYKGRKDTYGVDGSYNRLLADGRDISGRWQLINKNSQIEITGPDGKSKLYLQIESLDDKLMVLRPIVDEDYKMIIPVWYYTKIKS